MLSNTTQNRLAVLSSKSPNLEPSLGGYGNSVTPALGVVDSKQAVLTALGLIARKTRIGASLLSVVYLDSPSDKTAVEALSAWLVAQSPVHTIQGELIELDKAKEDPELYGVVFRRQLAQLLLIEINHLAGSHGCGYCKGRKRDCEHCGGGGMVANQAYGYRTRVAKLGMKELGVTITFWRLRIQGSYEQLLQSLLAELSFASKLLHQILDPR